MTGPPDVTVLAHHGLLLAIPAFIPALIVAGVVIYIAMRDRREGTEDSAGPHSNNPDSDRQDGSP
jgi:hypothetical protein